MNAQRYARFYTLCAVAFAGLAIFWFIDGNFDLGMAVLLNAFLCARLVAFYDEEAVRNGYDKPLDHWQLTKDIEDDYAAEQLARMAGAADTPVEVDGFEVQRGVKAKAGIATKAHADLAKTSAPGTDYVLHVNHTTLVPTIGRKTGPNWKLHIDANGVPSIQGKA